MRGDAGGGAGRRAHRGEAARDAFLRYGKGRHPAALNLGDCASCALAKARKLSLLFKGDEHGTAAHWNRAFRARESIRNGAVAFQELDPCSALI